MEIARSAGLLVPAGATLCILLAAAGAHIFSSPSIKRDERVLFFDTAARLDEKKGVWTIPIHGRVFEPEKSSHVRKGAIEAILKSRYGLEPDAGSRANFDRRVLLFLDDSERGKRVRIELGGREHVMPKSRANGHFHGTIELSAEAVASIAAHRTLTFRAVLPPGDSRRFEGTVHLPRPGALMVISDIDDTVKITGVTNRREMLERTFLRDFEAVPGMARLYTDWAGRGAFFHFVSSSPWQLYSPLREFLRGKGFPPAVLHLKLVRLTDRTFRDLFKPGDETKPKQIEPLLAAFPRSRFVLVGDSGERDPEVYGEIARKHPGRIAAIFIRNVTAASPGDERFRKAFATVDRSLWSLFTDPSRLALPAPPPPAPASGR